MLNSKLHKENKRLNKKETRCHVKALLNDICNPVKVTGAGRTFYITSWFESCSLSKIEKYLAKNGFLTAVFMRPDSKGVLRTVIFFY